MKIIGILFYVFLFSGIPAFAQTDQLSVFEDFTAQQRNIIFGEGAGIEAEEQSKCEAARSVQEHCQQYPYDPLCQ